METDTGSESCAAFIERSHELHHHTRTGEGNGGNGKTSEEELSMPTQNQSSEGGFFALPDDNAITSVSIKLCRKDKKAYVKGQFLKEGTSLKRGSRKRSMDPKGHQSSTPALETSAASRKEELPSDMKSGFVIATNIEETVACAASMVAAEIRSGVWVYNANKERPSRTNDSTQRSGMEAKLYSVSKAIEKFSVEIIVPALVSAGVGKLKSNVPVPGDPHIHRERVFIAALMSMREVLQINAEKVFFADVGPFTSSLKNTFSSKEEYQFRTSLLATSLVLSVAKKSGHVHGDASDKLLSLIRKYDRADQEFASCLEEVDGSYIGVTPTGKPLDKEENIAWKVSFNRNRAMHPLTRASSSIPPHNACYVSIVEND